MQMQNAIHLCFLDYTMAFYEVHNKEFLGKLDMFAKDISLIQNAL